MWTGLGQQSEGEVLVENSKQSTWSWLIWEILLHLRGKDSRVALNYLKDLMQNGLWSLDGELLPQHDQS